MKTIPAPLLAHYAAGTAQFARLWQITRLDGEVFGFTDADLSIEFEGLLYTHRASFDLSAVQTASDLAVDSASMRGVLEADFIDAESVERGKWDGATFVLREVCATDLAAGANILRAGEFGTVQRNGSAYTIELRGLLAKLENVLGRIVKPACNATLGDARCGVDIEALRVTGAVAAVTSNREFEVSVAASSDDDYALGLLTWTTGLNAGLSMEIKSVDSSGDTFELQLPMPHDVEVGDEFTVVPGCDKTKTTCIGVYNNLLNFRGFSFVPGQDQVLKVRDQ